MITEPQARRADQTRLCMHVLRSRTSSSFMSLRQFVDPGLWRLEGRSCGTSMRWVSQCSNNEQRECGSDSRSVRLICSQATGSETVQPATHSQLCRSRDRSPSDICSRTRHSRRGSPYSRDPLMVKRHSCRHMEPSASESHKLSWFNRVLIVAFRPCTILHQ